MKLFISMTLLLALLVGGFLERNRILWSALWLHIALFDYKNVNILPPPDMPVPIDLVIRGHYYKAVMFQNFVPVGEAVKETDLFPDYMPLFTTGRGIAENRRDVIGHKVLRSVQPGSYFALRRCISK